MKKFIVILACVALSSPIWAQIDSATIQRQQQQLLEQQQKEQQDLIKQQQKDQEKQLKEQQKEQEKQLKEQAREQQREQEELLAKQAKQLKKAERRESHDRRFYLSVDPYMGYTINSNFRDKNNPYHSGSMFWRGYRGDFVCGADLMAHMPLNKHWNFDLGVGYGLNRFAYTNDVNFDTNSNALVLKPQADLVATEIQYNGWLHHIEVPLLLSRCSTKGDTNWKESFFGVIIGYNTQANFRTRQWDANNDKVVSDNTNMLQAFNKYEAKVVLGTMEKTFIFAPGSYIYLNVLPTYVDPNHKVYEFGLVYKL